MMFQPKFRGMVTFDRSIIKTNWRKINEGPMKRAGLLVRKIARGSIRRGKKGGKAGPPGTPPKSRSNGRSGTPPFKMIYSVPYGLAGAIVGMVGFGAINPVPGLQEHGGVAVRRVFPNKAPRGRLKPGRDAKGRYTKATRPSQRAVRKPVRYPDRPFMAPALVKSKGLLPGLWKGSLNR